MSWYSDKKEIWKKIIDSVANDLKRNPIMIEKDTIQSMFLYELTKYDFPFVFKGGTSLSKTYNIINRFSEDIDLSLNRKTTESEKRKSKEIIMNTASKLGLVLTNPDKVMSRHDYNKYVFVYDSLFSEEKLEIVVETSYFQISYPANKKEISSYINSFCKNNNVEMPFEFDAMKFEMNVQSLERTFIDKIFAVCDYKIENMMDRDSRHLYDIAKIEPMIAYDDDLKELISKVRHDRMNSKNNPSANPKYNINEMLKDIIDSDFFKSDYNNITLKLLYENYSYEDAINNGIKKVQSKELF